MKCQSAGDSLTKRQRRRILAYKICKQICFFGIWLSMGLSSSINGPCLPDFMRILRVDYEEISRGLACESIGFFVGAILAGVLFEVLHAHRDLLVCLSEMLCATAMFILPWTTALWQFALCFFFVGLSDGSHNSGVNAMVLQLWGSQAGAPMFFMHFGFGVGALIVPQIAKPFISEVPTRNISGSTTPTSSPINISLQMIPQSGLTDYNTSNPCFANINGSDNQNCLDIAASENTTDSASTTLNRFFIPYAIVGCINTLVAMAFFLFYIKGSPVGLEKSTGDSLKTICSIRIRSSRHPVLYASLLILLFLFFFQAMGGEHIYGNFLYSYATAADVAFTKDQAATLTSVFWICFMCGRLFGGFLEFCIPTIFLLIFDFILMIIVAISLVLFGYTSKYALWGLTGALGLLIGPIFPAGMLWANAHLRITSLVTMVFIVGACAGLGFYVYAGGYMFNSFGPQSMMYFEVLCSCIMLSLLVALIFVGKKYLSVRAEEKGEEGDARDGVVAMTLLPSQQGSTPASASSPAHTVDT